MGLFLMISGCGSTETKKKKKRSVPVPGIETKVDKATDEMDRNLK
jgi:hypothetical protein